MAPKLTLVYVCLTMLLNTYEIPEMVGNIFILILGILGHDDKSHPLCIVGCTPNFNDS